jgi:hypothetical protein
MVYLGPGLSTGRQGVPCVQFVASHLYAELRPYPDSRARVQMFGIRIDMLQTSSFLAYRT